MCFNSSYTGQKLMKQKVNINLICALPSKLLIFITDHAESCFFFLSLTHFFITATYRRFSTSPAQAKTVCSHQNSFFLQNKGSNNPIWVGRHTKNQLKVVQAKFDDITCVPLCHNVNQMTKYEGYLILLEDISIKITGRGILYS